MSEPTKKCCHAIYIIVRGSNACKCREFLIPLLGLIAYEIENKVFIIDLYKMKHHRKITYRKPNTQIKVSKEWPCEQKNKSAFFCLQILNLTVYVALISR